MTDRSVNGLQGCLNSIAMVVAPGVSSDALAREQVGLLTRYLKFVSQRVERIHERARFELGWYQRMADGVLPLLVRAGRGDDELRLAADRAKECLASPDSGTPALHAAALALQTGLSRVVRGSRNFDPGLRRAVESIVLDASLPIITLQRAWFAPQAWEAQVPLSLDEALQDRP